MTDETINYAVLVPDGAGGWQIIHANGDLADARAKADEWVRDHIGGTAMVMQRIGRPRARVVVEDLDDTAHATFARLAVANG